MKTKFIIAIAAICIGTASGIFNVAHAQGNGVCTLTDINGNPVSWALGTTACINGSSWLCTASGPKFAGACNLGH